ncbi:hypothetical protein HHL11_31445 [Ramlibacter sp. G-1-2-2]|uniref:Uncharacterized protein n=1 Tax=Ramlibacter agri TaxID=2728837 RepID=A0A848HBA1_9BURK|nr:hypothetical protein [Ramlibacter agri]NML48306.1 hypothetical protein [Ramlibacter agri]
MNSPASRAKRLSLAAALALLALPILDTAQAASSDYPKKSVRWSFRIRPAAPTT